MVKSMTQSDKETIFTLADGTHYSVGVKEIEAWGNQQAESEEICEEDFLTFVEGHQDKLLDQTREKLSVIAKKSNYNKVVKVLENYPICNQLRILVKANSIGTKNRIKDELKDLLVKEGVMTSKQGIPEESILPRDTDVFFVPQIVYSSKWKYRGNEILSKLQGFINEYNNKENGVEVSLVDGYIRVFRGAVI